MLTCFHPTNMQTSKVQTRFCTIRSNSHSQFCDTENIYTAENIDTTLESIHPAATFDQSLGYVHFISACIIMRLYVRQNMRQGRNTNKHTNRQVRQLSGLTYIPHADRSNLSRSSKVKSMGTLCVISVMSNILTVAVLGIFHVKKV